MRVTHDHLSVEEGPDGTYRVVAWTLDGVPCTVDTVDTYDEASGLRDALAVTLSTWGVEVAEEPEEEPVTEHVILVAFTVEARGREAAHPALHDALLPLVPGDNAVTSWWVAEDDRADGSDNDSAVFVVPGAQARASTALAVLGLTPDHNIVAGEA